MRVIMISLSIAAAVAVGATGQTTLFQTRPTIHAFVAAAGGPGEVAAPTILVPGRRFTFAGGDSVLKHDAGALTLTPNSMGKISVNGQSFSLGTIGRGSGGVGHFQIDVLAVNRDEVVCEVRYYLSLGPGGPSKLCLIEPLIAHPSGCDWWIHPKILEHLAAESTGRGTGFQRCDYVHAGKRRAAAVLWIDKPDFKLGAVYDLDTGLLLSHHTRSHGSGGNTVQLNGFGGGTVTHGGSKVTTASHLQFVGFRDKALPWSAAPMDRWVDSIGDRIDWRGSQTTELPNGPPIRIDAGASLQIVHRAANWIGAEFRLRLSVRGLPPTTSNARRAFGPNQVGGLWIPPRVLRKLRSGQLLDRDPTTGVRFHVMGCDDHYITLAEENAVVTMSWLYDRQGGHLVSTRKSDRVEYGGVIHLQLDRGRGDAR